MSLLALELDSHEAAIELWLDKETAEGRALTHATAQRARAVAASCGGADALDRAGLRA